MPILSIDLDKTLTEEKIVGEDYHYVLNDDLVLFTWLCQKSLTVSASYINSHRNCSEVADYLLDDFFAETSLVYLIPHLQNEYDVNFAGVITRYEPLIEGKHYPAVLKQEQEVIKLCKEKSREERNLLHVKFTEDAKKVEANLVGQAQEQYDKDNQNKVKQLTYLAKKLPKERIVHIDDNDDKIIKPLKKLKEEGQEPFAHMYAVHYHKNDKQKKWVKEMGVAVGLEDIAAHFLTSVKNSASSKPYLKTAIDVYYFIYLSLTAPDSIKEIPNSIQQALISSLAELKLPKGIRRILVEKKILPEALIQELSQNKVLSPPSTPKSNSPTLLNKNNGSPLQWLFDLFKPKTPVNTPTSSPTKNNFPLRVMSKNSSVKEDDSKIGMPDFEEGENFKMDDFK